MCQDVSRLWRDSILRDTKDPAVSYMMKPINLSTYKGLKENP